MSRFLYCLARRAVRLVFVLLWKFRCRGERHIPPGPVLIICNHQSLLDLLLVSCVFPEPLWYVARETLRKHTLYRWLSRPFPVVHIRPGEGDRKLFDRLAAILKEGHSILLFPEGTRTRNGEILPFRGGFWHLARRAGVPVLPVRIWGAFETWPRNRLMPGPGCIRLWFYKPRPPSDRPWREAVQEIQQTIYS